MKFFYLIILNIIFLSSSFFAEEGYTFQKLYEVEVELESTDKNSINEGMGEALKELMVKLSGASKINLDQEIKKATSHPEGYISQYKLSSRNEKIIGTFSFNGETIRKLLSDNSLPLWIGIKPKILLFLPCEEQLGLIHKDKNSMGQIDELCFQAKRDIVRIGDTRNIIFIKPSLDLTDLRYIDVYQPKSINDFLDKITERYSLSSWITCFIHDEFGVMMDKPNCLSPDSFQERINIEQTIEILATSLSEDFQLRIDPNLRAEIKLLISGIQGYSDLVLVEEIIESNVLVISSNLDSIQGSSIIYQLEIKGSISDLEKLMNVNPHLSQQQDAQNNLLLEYLFRSKG